MASVFPATPNSQPFHCTGFEPMFCNSKRGCSIQLSNGNQYYVRYRGHGLEYKTINKFYSLPALSFSPINNNTLKEQDKVELLGAILTNTQVTNKVRQYYLASPGVDVTFKTKVLLQMRSQDIPSLFLEAYHQPNLQTYIDELCSLPQEQFNNLVNILREHYRHYDPTRHTIPVGVNLLIKKLSIRDMINFYSEVDPMFIIETLIIDHNICNINDICNNPQLMLVITYLPIEKQVFLINTLVMHMPTSPACLILLLARLQLELGTIQPEKHIAPLVQTKYVASEYSNDNAPCQLSDNQDVSEDDFLCINIEKQPLPPIDIDEEHKILTKNKKLDFRFLQLSLSEHNKLPFVTEFAASPYNLIVLNMLPEHLEQALWLQIEEKSVSNLLISRLTPTFVLDKTKHLQDKNLRKKERELVNTQLDTLAMFFTAPINNETKRLLIRSVFVTYECNLWYIASHLPKYALNDFFNCMEDKQQIFLKNWFIFLKEHPSQYIESMNHYFCTSCVPNIKKEIVKLSTDRDLSELVEVLPSSSTNELLSYTCDASHREILRLLLDQYPQHDENEFIKLINLLPSSSIQLLYQHFKPLPTVATLLNKNLKQETEYNLVIQLTDEEAIELLQADIQLIEKLRPKTLMQLNRKMSFDDWKAIASQLSTEKLHLWVDFVSYEQAMHWNLKSQRKHTIQLLVEFDADRCCDLITHVSKDKLVSDLLLIPEVNAARCIQKLCLDYRCIDILIKLVNQAHSYTKVKNITSQLEFSDQPHEACPKLSKSLFDELIALYQHLAGCQNGWYCAQTKQLTEPLAKTLALLQGFKFNDSKLKIIWQKRQDRITDLLASHNLAKNTNKLKLNRAVVLWENEHRKAQGQPYKFHTDVSGAIPTITEPMDLTTSNQAERMLGANKVAVQADSQSITFQPTNSATDSFMTKRDYIYHREIIRQLFVDLNQSYQLEPKSICTGLLGILPIDGKLVVAHGGISLKQEISDTKSQYIVPLYVFMGPCRDLKLINSVGYFLGDIKPENFVIKDCVVSRDGQRHRLAAIQLKYIDIGSICCTRSMQSTGSLFFMGNPYQKCGTFVYSTLKHIYLKMRPSDLQTSDQLKAKDEYAFLLTMMVSMSTKFRGILHEIFTSKKFTREEISAFVDTGKTSNTELDKFQYGILTVLHGSQYKTNIVIQVIKKLIKPEYQMVITDFLKDPSDYPLPIDINLFDVINWNERFN